MKKIKPEHDRRLGIVLVLVAAMAWSTAGLFTRVVSTDIPTTLFWRSLTGGLCVMAMYLCTQKGETLRGAFRFSLGEFVVATLSTCGMLCFISAFFYTTIANVSFVYGTMPLVTFVLAFLVLKEKGDWVSFSSCVLCVAGVAIILWGSQRFDDVFGIVLALGMTFFMASLTIAAKYFPDANAVKATYLSGFLGALATVFFSSFGNILPVDYFWLTLYGLVNVGAGFGIYLLGVQRVPAVTAALVGLTEIPVAPVWAWLLFRENPGINALIGGAIILFATTVYLLMTSGKQSDHGAKNDTQTSA